MAADKVKGVRADPPPPHLIGLKNVLTMASYPYLSKEDVKLSSDINYTKLVCTMHMIGGNE